jgi:HEAT repeat protein
MITRILEKQPVMLTDEEIKALVDALADGDGVARHNAREQLERVGKPAVPHLVFTLRSPSEHARWEAAKALAEIADPSAAPALVNALCDEKAAVRWLAGNALINLGHDALAPLLRGLEASSDSIWFRDGAHHVLRSLIREGEADEAIPVMEALENLEPRIEAPIAAYHVLQELNGGMGVSAPIQC